MQYTFKLKLFFTDVFNIMLMLEKTFFIRIIKENEVCSLKVFNRLTEQPLLSNLKHLALFRGDSSFEFDSKKLNKFGQLVHLDLDDAFLGKKKANLNLPELKFLAFRNQCLAITSTRRTTTWPIPIVPWIS